MARTLWGKVYLKDVYAGRLWEEPGGRCVFAYDADYLDRGGAAIAHTLPPRAQSYVSERGLHPFFDNLVAEGWLRNAQARALGVDPANGFALLLGFGHDLAGAVSVEDPEPQARTRAEQLDDATLAALRGRASLSGVQRKLLVVPDGGTYRPVGPEERSSHIAKLAAGQLGNLLELEVLTTRAVGALLPDDDVVEMALTRLPAIDEPALIVRRFDRTRTGKPIHFEEFSQLLGKHSGDDKYDGDYEEMGRFIRRTPSCMPVEADRLLRRILACLLVGNTDAHFKNFAMFHRRDGLRLTPAYDLVAASVYPEYQTIALGVAGTRGIAIGALQAKHVAGLGAGFGVPDDALMDGVKQLGKRLPRALEAVAGADVGPKALRDTLQDRLEKRWRGSFASIGRLLSKRHGRGAADSG